MSRTTKADTGQQRTLAEIAAEAGVSIYAARRALDRTRVRPARWFGHTAVYDTEGAGLILTELRRVAERRQAAGQVA